MRRKLTKLKAWHVLPPDARLRYNDGRLAQPGVKLSVLGPPVPCIRGLHASYRLRDALNAARTVFDFDQGFWICRIILSGEIVADDKGMPTRKVYKHAATERTIEWMVFVSVDTYQIWLDQGYSNKSCTNSNRFLTYQANGLRMLTGMRTHP